VKIEAVGEKGDGIAKVKGFVIFVPGAKQGDDVRIKITKVFKKVGFGEVVGASSGSSDSGSSESSEESQGESSESEEESYEESNEGTSEDAEEF
ncbi:TRAM domain-containing protein, partial [Candidatus Woesearchaeota archaeon]|nr:TRAM domain-containing protein [Candidatus Woesearchaeota archaeon]